MTRRLLWPLAACLLAAACQKGPAPEAPAPSALEELTSRLPNRRPCSVTIPGEWGPGVPVPAVQDGKLVYKVFFAGWEGNPKKGIKDHDAEGDATFTPDGAILSCTRRENEPAKYAAHLDSSMSRDQWDALRARLFSLTAKVASEYASGKPDPEVVKDYSAAFAQYTDRELAASYRALSPGFWKWLEANGGSGPGASGARR